jgi:RNA polymerase sigma-70 factor (ECF subfamily)
MMNRTAVARRGDDALVTSDSTASVATARDAFERLTQRRLDRAYRFAATILGDEEEAQDAVHDAAVRAWTHWAGLRETDRFDAWFDRIVVNVCRDRLRQAGSRRWMASLNERSGQEVAESTGDRDLLARALAQLSTDHKIVIALKFLEDQSVEEIADRTGVRSGTVKSRLHYALRELRAGYEAALRSGSRSDT